MDFATMLSRHPDARPADPAAIAEAVRLSGRILVVLDDDPTGTQSVADLPVLSRWGVDDLGWALDTGAAAVYVLTNTRSHDAETAARINREVVEAAAAAADARGIPLAFVSRGDSTLRGHFPLEPDVISATLRSLGRAAPSATIVVPAFPDAGRVTVGGIHGMVADGTFTPIGETEFARDSTFGYRKSRLADWVHEKTAGEVSSESVVEITLDTLRAGGIVVADALLAAPEGAVVVVDAVEEDDLRQLALGLEIAESDGRSYVYRVGPPFVRARIGLPPRPALATAPEATRTDLAVGGLVVVGSHVGLTSRQLDDLTVRRPDAVVVELDVPSILDPAQADAVLDDAVSRIVGALGATDVVVHSSRTLIRTDDPDESLAISRAVSDALVQVVQRTVQSRPPRYVIAKGGITSSDIATRGLGIDRAMVRGSLFPGIVSLWEPVAGPAAGIPYVVFAGNVGGDTTLTDAVAKLSARKAC